MLAQINAHPRDSQIIFKDEGHVYTIEGLEGHPVSVTTIIHHFFPQFDADKVISKMMNGRNWCNSQYNGMTREEIKQQWRTNGENASGAGTKMHKSIEDYINEEVDRPKPPSPFLLKLPTLEEINKEVTQDIPLLENNIPKLPGLSTQTIEFGYFLRFWNDIKIGTPGFRPYRTEWLVFDKEKALAGSIDLVLINDAGEVIICDWKRSKAIVRENDYGEKGLDIFSHLDHCNYNHYCIQLNTYQKLLETNYGKKVVGRFLIILHPINKDYVLIPVPRMEKEIEDLWNVLPMTIKKH